MTTTSTFDQTPERHSDVVIVGASHAGVECAWALRASGFTGSVLLVNAETAPPYQKPPLSKAMLAGGLDNERLLLRALDTYPEQVIDLVSGLSATQLDPSNQRLRLSDDSVVRFNHCVLATGARARRLPGLNGANVYAIRTLTDAQALRSALLPGHRLLVIGGGYLGLETASSAAKLGVHVTVLECASSLMAGKVSAHTASEFAALHRASGINIVCNASPVVRWERNGEGWCAWKQDGDSLRADSVLVCIGAIANTELAQTAGLRCDEHGIVVDTACRTSAANVYAIGDCASSFRPQWGCHGRVESVQNAMTHARVAATAIAGIAPHTPRATTFWSEQQGRRLQMAGLISPDVACDDRVVATAKGWLVERYQHGTLAVVEAVDSPVDFMHAVKRLGTPNGPSKP